ncbi:hypothetical protein SAMN05660236_5232 [Ohtaekwangia koreensis]|uniref:Uncharacterized protein n=2 Tax=Ohtaekwangia koreensis TaxID=688867 RepID=A0A1T5MET6_9BACT|nr:hypothetical protein SAMN05660236_5232 [Ohtaekwangia koreensis]
MKMPWRTDLALGIMVENIVCQKKKFMTGVVWLLDNYSEDVISDLENKGYLVRRFSLEKQHLMQYDERPDMIFFSELTASTASFFTKIHQLYPGVMAMSLPSLMPTARK